MTTVLIQPLPLLVKPELHAQLVPDAYALGGMTTVLIQPLPLLVKPELHAQLVPDAYALGGMTTVLIQPLPLLVKPELHAQLVPYPELQTQLEPDKVEFSGIFMSEIQISLD